MKEVVYIQSIDSKEGYRISYSDLRDLESNVQLNSNYEITFTLTYSNTYKKAFEAAKAKANVFFDGEIYNIQQAQTQLDKDGLLELKVTANHSMIDKMKNVRVDTVQPTEDNPQSNDNKASGNTGDKQKQPGVEIKKTSEQETFTLEDRLKKFFDNNDQHINYELHGDFPKIAVDVKDTSLYEWLGSHLKEFSAYYIPVGNTLHIYDLGHLQHQTGRQFRYNNNMDNADVQLDVNDLVNDCMVYGGKMEKDITTGGAGGGGSLESAEAFAKSPINATFGVNKQQMINDFASRDVRVLAWGVDANRLYDTVKNAGISPEWFFAYDLQEGNPTSYSWLNHFGNHLADPYADARRVCDWIKSIANRDAFVPASGYGAYASPQLTAQWNQEFGKGTIGRLYLQGTAAAVMEMANENSGRYGRPLAGCVAQIKAWGGHTVQSGLANQFVQYCRSFVGKTPYVWGGSSPAGWDCSGFVAYVYNHYGVPMHQPTTYEEYQGTVVGPPYQTGDMLFYGARGNTYHVVLAMDDKMYVAAADEQEGTVYKPIANFPPAFGVRNPKMASILGGNATGDGSDSTSTETQTYYALSYHFEDQESIKKYGRHRGKTLTVDSIYDMDALKKYADTNIQHDPKTTLTIKDFTEKDFGLGDVWRVVIKELQMQVEVTLLGIKYKPFNEDNSQASLTFNNSSLAMKNVINAIYKDISNVNVTSPSITVIGTGGARTDDHVQTMLYLTDDQAAKAKALTEGGNSNATS